MQYAIATSFVFLLIISIIFFVKPKINNKDTKLYRSIITINLVGLFIDFMQFMLIKYDANYFLSVFMGKIFLIYVFVWTFMLYQYVLLVSYNEKYEKEAQTFNVIAEMILLLGSIAVIILPIEIVNDNTGIYSKGLSCIAAYVVISLDIIFMLIATIKNIKNIENKKKYIPFLVFLGIGSIATILQYLFPRMLLITPVEAIITLLIYFFIENPDIKMVQQLGLAKDQADKANRAKTEFLSSMSHEIRTPLNAITGFSRCILDANTIEEAKENAKDIVDASDTLLDIVNGILDISKIEAGKLEIVNTVYNAPETFNELAKLITPKMKEKGLDFTYYIASDLPKTLYGDPANLKKIVTNLLSNACKYTKTGFVRYEVNCVNMNDYSRLIISVEDSGQGIKKENIAKLFERFKRLEEDKNTTIEGTGLGLAITKQLTELMGGKIIVHSVYGTGSKFTIVLNQKIETKDIVPEHRYKTTLNLNDVKILLVDDTVLNLKVAKKLLERHNANCITTIESGFDCLNRIENGEVYDVILLDDMMPKMSGVETLKKLKEISGFKIPVIALTANAITGMKEKYLSEGFNSYLAKPIQDDELIRAMNEVLGRTVTEQMEVVKSEEPEKEDEEENKTNEIIPVEENIELELGNKLEISKKPIEKITSTKKYDIDYLKEGGFDIDSSLQLIGDINTYNKTISAYLDDVESRWDRIVEYKNSSDLDKYLLEVHSLKNSSKYIGLNKLSDIAYQHELKSKENDSSFINNHFSELKDEYSRTIEIVKNYVKYNCL